MTWARLAFKLQPSSIGFAAFVCLALTAAALWLASDMRSVLDACGTPNEPKACQVVFAFQDTHGQAVMMTQMGIGLAMYGIPLVLGVPILTREIERRTAMIAWPMAGSRLKWLAWRVVPVLVVALVLIGVMAFAADQLAQAYFPHSDIGFDRHGVRGLSLVARSMLMLVAAVLLGAVVGRLLPALLIGIALAVGISTAMDAALPHWASSAELTGPETEIYGPGPLRTGGQYRLADGTLISAQEGEILVQERYEQNGGEEPDPAVMPQQVMYGTAAERYGEVLIRESAVLGVATILAAVAAVTVVQRRRPE
ncbi:MAG: hypothetical protein ACRDGD_05080 [Candidatus Limnocylindria bacterium]